MEILKSFGFEPVLLVAQIVNFLIIFFLLKRFLYKPVLDVLKKRKDLATDTVTQAEKTQKTLEKTLEEEKKILNKASEEAKKYLTDAKNQSLEVSKEIEEESRKQAEKILLEAKAQIEQESKDAEGRLSKKVSELAKVMISKSLEDSFSEKEQNEITKKALSKLEKVK
jgi:F-type H+-transporting ATPase subunit b